MSGSINVAVLEDHRQLRAALRQGLTEEGFAVTAAATAGEFLGSLQLTSPHVLIIDIGLPDADGRDVCQAARSIGVTAPVLFLSARSDIADRLAGFAAGGDDYLVKPFEFDELIARVRVLARRALLQRDLGSKPNVPVVTLDPVNLTASFDGRDLALSQTEFRVLAALVSREGELVRRQQLASAAWPSGHVSEQSIDSYIARVRRKLKSAHAPLQITTVHGLGYRVE